MWDVFLYLSNLYLANKFHINLEANEIAATVYYLGFTSPCPTGRVAPTLTSPDENQLAKLIFATFKINDKSENF